MPSDVCVSTAENFLMCNLKVDLDCEGENFYACPFAEFFLVTSEISKTRMVGSYGQVIKSGPREYFQTGKDPGPPQSLFSA